MQVTTSLRLPLRLLFCFGILSGSCTDAQANNTTDPSNVTSTHDIEDPVSDREMEKHHELTSCSDLPSPSLLLLLLLLLSCTAVH